MMTDQTRVIHEVLAPIHRAVPILAAAWDGERWQPSHAGQLRRAAMMLRPAALALAELVSELTLTGDGPQHWTPCHSCCGAGAAACERCSGSGAEPAAEESPENGPRPERRPRPGDVYRAADRELVLVLTVPANENGAVVAETMAGSLRRIIPAAAFAEYEPVCPAGPPYSEGGAR